MKDVTRPNGTATRPSRLGLLLAYSISGLMSALMTLHFFFREVRWTSNSSLLVLWVAVSLAIDLAPYMVIIILSVLGGRYGGRSLISFIITAGGSYCVYDLLGRFYTVYLF